ncbi:GntR family transcriptional regulator [Dactylosporangium sp. NPDC048998]|uniref:GntR family transcriptional regulator n=1 Tax=Dactylosporangium sp. NPDC048998 TaxID=3363976 RepID=UPI003710D485
MHAINARPFGFRDVASTLREQMLDGTHQPGARLPSEAVLADQFGCSRDTIRDALAVLTTEGFLVKRRGRATTVRPYPQRTTVPLPAGATVTARPITLPEADALGCGPGVAILEVRAGDAEPALYRGDQHILAIPPALDSEQR